MSNPNLLVIGSSTGGLKILEQIFTRLPLLRAAVVIIQHITPMVDRSFVTSLQCLSVMPVSLAKENEEIIQGNVYLAPGALHLTFQDNRRLKLAAGEKVNSVCPSIDVAMLSVKPTNGAKMTGVILTGMGRDGADGITKMKSCGAITIAQDQKTSVIYGMPKAAAETGKIDFILPTEKIADKLAEIYR